MKREGCPMAPLVEARRDGRLAARDVASLERHLATCASCARTAEGLARIAARVQEPLGAPPTPLEHQRGRLALLRAAAQTRPRIRPSLRLRAAQGIAAAAAIVCLVAAARWRRDPGPIAVARHLPPIARLPELRAETVIRPSEGARFTRTDRGTLTRIDLVDGALDLEVRKLGPDERFLVATSDAEVEVRGTIFRVEARDSRLVRVSVTEGRVEVRSLESTALIPAGGDWLPHPAPPGKPAPDKSIAVRTPQSHAPAEPPTPDGSKELAEGLRLIERGEDAAAADKLNALRDANPGDPHAEDAAYLAVLSLDRAGRSAQAKDAARRFVTLYPKSPRRQAMEAIASRP